MKNFSEKIFSARKLLNLSQKELADLIGVSMRTIVSYETTDARPRMSTLVRLASALHVSREYLLQDQIQDPSYGLKKEPYADEIKEKYGAQAAQEISFLTERSSALFAGGEIPQEAKDAYFEAIMAAYLECKNQARERYSHHSVPEDENEVLS